MYTKKQIWLLMIPVVFLWVVFALALRPQKQVIQADEAIYIWWQKIISKEQILKEYYDRAEKAAQQEWEARVNQAKGLQQQQLSGFQK